MFIYTSPTHPRTNVERFFKFLYNTAFVLNFGAFFIAMADFSARLDNTYSTYWRHGNLVLADSLKAFISDCEVTSSVSINGVKSETVLSLSTLEFAFLSTTALIVGIFVAHGLLMCTDFCTKLLYAFNIRCFRMGGLLLRFNWIQPFWLFLYSVFDIALIVASRTTRIWLQSYVDTCATRLWTVDATKYVQLESDKDVVFGTNLDLILAAIIINAIVYFFALLYLIFDGCKAENRKLLQYQHPWERGCLGRPDNVFLSEWAKQRTKLGRELLKDRPDPQVLPLLEYAVHLPKQCDEFQAEYHARVQEKEALTRKLEQQEREGIQIVSANLHRRRSSAPGGGPYLDPGHWAAESRSEEVADAYQQEEGGMGNPQPAEEVENPNEAVLEEEMEEEEERGGRASRSHHHHGRKKKRDKQTSRGKRSGRSRSGNSRDEAQPRE